MSTLQPVRLAILRALLESPKDSHDLRAEVFGTNPAETGTRFQNALSSLIASRFIERAGHRRTNDVWSLTSLGRSTATGKGQPKVAAVAPAPVQTEKSGFNLVITHDDTGATYVFTHSTTNTVIRVRPDTVTQVVAKTAGK